MNFYSIILNILLLVVGIVAALVAIEYFVRFQQKRRWQKEDFTTLLIRVARDNETGPIVAEQIFSTIHGVAKSIGFFDRLKGVTQDKMSFEIASTDRSIRFYAHFPTRLRNLIEGQIYAQYPNVEITEITDYARPKPVEVSEKGAAEAGVGEGRESKELVKMENQLQKKQERQFMAVDELKNAIGADLAMSSPDIFPIKRYPQFEDKSAKIQLDPLSAITSTLAKFNDPDEQAWIQVVVQPLDDKWRSIFTKCIRILNKGIYLNIARLQGMYARAYTTRSRIVRTIFFPIYWLFGLQGLNSGASVENSNASVAPDDSSRTHDRESGLQGAQDKVGKLLYEANVRIVYVPKHANKDVALVKLREIAGSFKQFSVPQVNGFVLGNIARGEEIVKRYQNRELIKPFVMSTEELATVYHLPNVTVTTPNIYWVRSRRLEPPGDLPTPKEIAKEDLTMLGKTNFRGGGHLFGIKTLDRRRHIYIIGKTGMGKSTLIENMIFFDI